MSRLAESFKNRPLPIPEIIDYPFSVKEVTIAGDLGPCGGVNTAIQTTQEILSIVNKKQPVYANRQPVHNELITNEFKTRGLIIQPNISLLKKGDIIILSAHGTPPSQVNELKKRGVLVVNSECELVDRDRKKAVKVLSQGQRLLYLGVSNHPEPIAVIEDLKNDFNEEDIIFTDTKTNPENINLPKGKPIKVLTQTTVSVEGTKITVNKLKRLNEDILISDPIGDCYATDNRQNAVIELFSQDEKPDFLLVIGSKESHNTTELYNIGLKFLGENQVKQINSVSEINKDWFLNVKKVGFTSGASVLDKYSEEVLLWLQQKGARLNFLPGKEDRKDNKIIAFPKPTAEIELVRQYIKQTYEN